MSVKKRKEAMWYIGVLIFLIVIFVITTAIFLWSMAALLAEWIEPIESPVVPILAGAIIGISGWQISRIERKLKEKSKD